MLERVHVIFSVAALIGFIAAAPACTKTESASSGTAASATPTASATTAATTAAPDAAPAAADTTVGTTPTAGTTTAAAEAGSAPAPKAGASAAKAGEDLTAANAACGTKPQPDCPLQAWMKSNTNSAIASNDLPALAAALDKAATFAPPGYTNWASISKDGAKAAKAGDMTAAKASCKTCHDQYKTKYKAELRGRKI